MGPLLKLTALLCAAASASAWVAAPLRAGRAAPLRAAVSTALLSDKVIALERRCDDGDVAACALVANIQEYRFPGRRYFAAHADELLCAHSGCRQRSNAAKIIEDGLRLVRYEVDAGTPASTSRTASRESTRAS